MRTRRRFLLGAGTAGVAGLAGCAAPARSSGASEGAAAGRGPRDPGPENAAGIVRYGFPASLCERPPVEDVGIRAVVAPAYGPDWDDVDVPERYRLGAEVGTGLDGDSYVVGVERGGRTRAYPLSVLWYHEAVNDGLAGPILVTYCPICRSGMVAERTVEGAPATFTVSGHLWQPPRVYAEASVLDGRTFGATATEGSTDVRPAGNLVLVDDETGSYWSQILARAVCGPESGDRLTIVPSTVTTWTAWRETHPETDVLLPPPHSALA
jgi:hypothetical protein